MGGISMSEHPTIAWVGAFKTISREIVVKPEHILFFDDSLENVSGAEKIGMPAVHVASPEDIEISLKEILA